MEGDQGLSVLVLEVHPSCIVEEDFQIALER